MPIYEFKCLQCGTVIAKLCKIGEEGKDLSCAACGQVGLQRKISSFASPGVAGGDGCTGGPGGCGGCSGCH